MGGSGGGGSSYSLSRDELRQLETDMARKLAQQRADAEINSYLRQQLIAINDRNTGKIDGYLDSIEQAIRDDIDEFDRLMYGGSIAKHTYVEGLSDVDSLVVLKDPGILKRSPEQFRHDFREALKSRFPEAKVTGGARAITVEFGDGTQVQLLPAVRSGDQVSISSVDGTTWQRIRPKAFTDALTRTNASQGRAVIPAIKLAKQIIEARIPHGRQPSGYHVESIAVEAFSRYEGSRSPKSMLSHLFHSASERVSKPMADPTGQSTYVDSSLGEAGSPTRVQLQNDLRQIAEAIDTSRTIDEWHGFLGD